MVGKRYSKQRELIYQCLKHTNEHPTAEMIYQKLKPENTGLSLGTVYRNLNLLAQQGYVVRIPSAVDHYDAVTAPHGHLECRRCGRLFDLRGNASQVIKLFSQANQGLRLDSCSVVFQGLCEDCSKGDTSGC